MLFISENIVCESMHSDKMDQRNIYPKSKITFQLLEHIGICSEHTLNNYCQTYVHPENLLQPGSELS